MDKHYFFSLSKTQKIDFIWNYGEVINEIKTPKTYNSLFILHDFFVEIKLSKRSNEIISIAIQENSDTLYSYLEKLDLNVLQFNLD